MDNLLIKELSADHYIFSTTHSMKYFEEDECIEKKLSFFEERIVIEDIPFTYHINENGFRSKSFKKFDDKEINILFAGCSITQGVGLPEDQCWYRKFIYKLEKDFPNKKISFYNLSINGGGYETIFKNILTFINTVGKPNFIFCLFPNIGREIRWCDDSYRNLHYYENESHINQLSEFDKKHHLIYKKNYCKEDSLMKFSNLINFLEIFSEFCNIKFLWSTWSSEEKRIFSKLKFKNYFSINEDLGNLFIVSDAIQRSNGYYESDKEKRIRELYLNQMNKDNEPYWLTARDGFHPGSYAHTIISDLFYKQCIKKDLFIID